MFVDTNEMRVLMLSTVFSELVLFPAAEVEREHDLLWLRQNGFEPSGNRLFAQYFATTADMNTEVGLSILHRIESRADPKESGPVRGRW